jgi:hypothetical protein
MAKTDLQVYVAHCSKFTQRKSFLKKELKKMGLSAQWCTDEPESSLHFTDNPDIYKHKLHILNEVDGPHGIGKIPAGAKAVSWTHLTIWKRIAESQNPYALILEDDAVLEKDFTTRFYDYLRKTPMDWDVIFMGCGAKLHVPSDRVRQGQCAYLMEPQRSRCTDSYLINRKASQIISRNVLPFSFPVDWELGYLLRKYGLRVYWWEPPLVRQGSETGLYRSGIREEWHHNKMKFKIWRAWESLKSKL